MTKSETAKQTELLIFNELENLVSNEIISDKQFLEVWNIISYRLQTKDYSNPYNILSIQEQRILQSQKVKLNLTDLSNYIMPGLNDSLLKLEHYRQSINKLKPLFHIPESEKYLFSRIKSNLDKVLTEVIIIKDLLYDISNCQDESELELLTKQLRDE